MTGSGNKAWVEWRRGQDLEGNLFSFRMTFVPDNGSAVLTSDPDVAVPKP